jgi:hypothetical protein
VTESACWSDSLKTRIETKLKYVMIVTPGVPSSGCSVQGNHLNCN